MSKKRTVRDYGKMSAKALAGLMLEDFLEIDHNRPPKLTPGDVEKIMKSLIGKPQEAREYNAWVSAYDQIYILQQQAELFASGAMLSLMTLVRLIEQHYTAWVIAGLEEGLPETLQAKLPNLGKKPSESIDTIKSEAKRAIRQIQGFLALQEFLGLFSREIDVDFTEDLPEASSALEGMVTGYNSSLENASLMPEIADIPKINFSTLQPDPEWSKHCIKALESYLGPDWLGAKQHG